MSPLISNGSSERHDPLTARTRFQLRTPLNLTLVFGSYVILVAFLWSVFSFLIVILAGIAVFVLYKYVLRDRVISLNCPECSAPIESTTPWICGHCQKRNDHVDDFPFLNRCEHCGIPPKAYKCHHCSKLIFLTQDNLAVNYARSVVAVSEPVSEEPDMDAEELAKLDREKRKAEHDLFMARKEAELSEVKQKAAFLKKKSPDELIAESFEKFHAQTMGAYRYTKKMKTEFAELYKDDPAALQKANEMIDKWLEDQE